MTKREARRIALRLAYEAVQKAVLSGGDEAGQDEESQLKIEDELDAIAQRMFERMRRAEEKR